jgi:arsenate reductase
VRVVIGVPLLQSGEKHVISAISVLPHPLARSMNVRHADGTKGRNGMATSITIYGIKNCDTMKKARAWLDGHGVAYGFHDYKTEGIERARLLRWAKQVGWETLLNRAGTTFRKLDDADKEALDETKAIALMLAQPSMIKRPVLDLGGKLLVGFKPEIYAKQVV